MTPASHRATIDSRYVNGTYRVEDTDLILSYERARDTLSIIDAFIEAGDFDADPTHFELVYNDELETITVLVKGLTYMMHVGSDDDAYAFTLETEVDDDALPRVVIVPFREIDTLTWDKGSWPKT